MARDDIHEAAESTEVGTEGPATAGGSKAGTSAFMIWANRLMWAFLVAIASFLAFVFFITSGPGIDGPAPY